MGSKFFDSMIPSRYGLESVSPSFNKETVISDAMPPVPSADISENSVLV